MTKIVSEQEVLRWFDEGRTYAWMSEQYRTRYHLETVPSMWGNFRRRNGLTRRIERNDDLIPWAVEKSHRNTYPVAMLRVLARRRAGVEVREVDDGRLDGFLAKLERDNVVVDYDPASLLGFKYVPRLPSDRDVIRKPKSKTSTRLNGDI